MAGFIEPVITEKSYIFKGFTKLTGQPINPSGDWRAYLPQGETQIINGQDTFACTDFGTRNAIAILSNYLKNLYYGSARELAVASGTSPIAGNDPDTVAENVRKQGLAREIVYPSTAPTIQEFYQALPQNVKDDTQSFFQKFSFGHEFVSDDITHLKEALTYSPVCVSVKAWYPNSDGTYSFPNGVAYDHWTTLVYMDDQYYYIFDSADPYLKKLTLDCRFSYAKKYELGAALIPTQNAIIGLLKKVVKLFQQWLTKDTQPVIVPDEILSPPVPSVPQPTQEPSKPTQNPVQPTQYLWDTPEHAKHSVRVICDEEGLSYDMKNRLCDTVQGESGFIPTAERVNTNGSLDCGIAQFNTNTYQKEFNMTCQECKNNPEKCVRIMAQSFKKGRASNWVAYQKLYPNG